MNLDFANLKKAILLNFVSINTIFEYNGYYSQIIALNDQKSAKMINKYRNCMKRFLLNSIFCLPLSIVNANQIFSENGIIEKKATFFLNDWNYAIHEDKIKILFYKKVHIHKYNSFLLFSKRRESKNMAKKIKN